MSQEAGKIVESLPFFAALTEEQKQKLRAAAELRELKAGQVIQREAEDCLGLLLICRGRLRTYLLSEEGREVTLYRLFPRDICLLSASCAFRSIQFNATIEAEKDSEILVLPAALCREIMEASAFTANFLNEVMADRFSEVMWLMEQILWKRFDQRLAGFLLTEAELEGGDCLHLTHETIGRHLGTAREVVTRMLRYFQGEGWVELRRGTICLRDRQNLEALRDQ